MGLVNLLDEDTGLLDEETDIDDPDTVQTFFDTDEDLEDNEDEGLVVSGVPHIAYFDLFSTHVVNIRHASGHNQLLQPFLRLKMKYLAMLKLANHVGESIDAVFRKEDPPVTLHDHPYLGLGVLRHIAAGLKLGEEEPCDVYRTLPYDMRYTNKDLFVDLTDVNNRKKVYSGVPVAFFVENDEDQTYYGLLKTEQGKLIPFFGLMSGSNQVIKEMMLTTAYEEREEITFKGPILLGEKVDHNSPIQISPFENYVFAHILMAGDVELI